MAVSLENASLYKRQQELITASQRFVPLDFIKALGRQSILQVQLGDGINKDMTVMFADIRSYSSIAEGLSVEDNFKFINTYLQLVGPVIRKNNGFINHYHGDGFIALFTRDAGDALNASIQILQAMDGFNQERVQNGAIPIKLGIGVHTGSVMMGIIGDGERQDANVISDAVNTASRLEGMTKTFGSTIILSEQTLEKIEDGSQYQTRFIGKVRMVGKEEVTTVYELFNADDYEIRAKKQRTLETYNKALEDYFGKRFGESAVSFKNVVDQFPEDNSSKRYLDQAARYLVEGVDSDWQGVETLSVK
jgi:class 3 adenylate cyclase